ncbi:MAG: hypothetical protein ACI8RD_006190 [Bacillariaceae sp.]|jgi:hypothetical protein
MEVKVLRRHVEGQYVQYFQHILIIEMSSEVGLARSTASHMLKH